MKVQDLFNTKYDASGWTNEQKTKFLDKADALGFRVPPPIYSRFNADNAYYLNYEENERSPFGVLFATSGPSLNDKCARKELLYKDVMTVEIEHPQKPAVEIEEQGDIDAELDAIFGKAPGSKEEFQKELDASAKKWEPNDGFKYERVAESIFDLKEEFEAFKLYKKIGDSNFAVVGHEITLISSLADGSLHRKVEKEWYECIPEGGVLCWVWDFNESSDNPEIEIISGFGGDLFWCKGGTEWNNAKPLTKEELKQFMDNAPE